MSAMGIQQQLLALDSTLYTSRHGTRYRSTKTAASRDWLAHVGHFCRILLNRFRGGAFCWHRKTSSSDPAHNPLNHFGYRCWSCNGNSSAELDLRFECASSIVVIRPLHSNCFTLSAAGRAGSDIAESALPARGSEFRRAVRPCARLLRGRQLRSLTVPQFPPAAPD